jgi:hypothetical protein
MDTTKLAIEVRWSASGPSPAGEHVVDPQQEADAPTPTSAQPTAPWPTSGVRAIAGTIIETMPAAGRKMM